MLPDALGAIVGDLEQAPPAPYVTGDPTFGVHVDVRGMSRHGPPAKIPAMMDSHGWGAEIDRTLVEFEADALTVLGSYIGRTPF